jgi:glutathione peroxidase
MAGKEDHLMKRKLALLMAYLFLFAGFTGADVAKNLYDISVATIDGEEVAMRQFENKVLLIVNVASRCGFTKQYAGLQSLYMKYKDKGLVVLGFPANDFRSQEPGTNEEIKAFCQKNYGVTFPMFAKIEVTGEGIHPLYRYLTSREKNPSYAGKITWNFNKFLINRQGVITHRFGTRVEPKDKKIRLAIENALAK